MRATHKAAMHLAVRDGRGTPWSACGFGVIGDPCTEVRSHVTCEGCIRHLGCFSSGELLEAGRRLSMPQVAKDLLSDLLRAADEAKAPRRLELVPEDHPLAGMCARCGGILGHTASCPEVK